MIDIYQRERMRALPVTVDRNAGESHRMFYVCSTRQKQCTKAGNQDGVETLHHIDLVISESAALSLSHVQVRSSYFRGS